MRATRTSRQPGLRLLAAIAVSLSLAACGQTTSGAVVKTPATTGSSSAATASKSKAARLLQRAVADATARGSVHETEIDHAPQGTIRFSDDIAAGTGRQDIRRSGGVVAHVLVIGGTAYFSGNMKALTAYFGVPAATAHTIGARWVAVSSSHPGYSTVAANVTLGSALEILKLKGHLTDLAPTVIHGHHVIGIAGTAPDLAGGGAGVRGTVYLTRSQHPLPVEVRFTHGRATFTADFTRWGERVSLKAPTNTFSPTG